WDDTGLTWRRTSPNIPKSSSPLYYLATGIVGSLDGVEIGTGGASPFEFLQGPGLNGAALVSKLKSTGYPGVGFSQYGNGVRLSIYQKAGANLTQLAVHLLVEANRAANPSLFARYRDADSIFWKVYGSTNIRTMGRREASPPQ